MAFDMTLREQILMRLVEVIDPETGIDVLRMQLIEDLDVDEASGRVSYCFHPSSPLCPLAYSLALDIKRAVATAPGVTEQSIVVTGYINAEDLTARINRE